ncbi:MAG: hypothetical protein LBB56_02725 [Chitinispirillales bacterium]|jgi:hypothetical protein|nr:hypothetical protein [Chitinispirillales bacterium]
MSTLKKPLMFALCCLAIAALLSAPVWAIGGMSVTNCTGDTSEIMNCGDSIAAKPIPISSFEELRKIGRDEGYPLNGHYELTANIDASESRNEYYGWAPIGTWTYSRTEALYCPNRDGELDCSGSFTIFFSEIHSSVFTGIFDGNGYAIRGLYINNNPSGSYTLAYRAIDIVSAGLFGVLNGATVRNLSIEVDTISGDVTNGGYEYTGVFVGALAGLSRNSVITNCHVKGTLLSPSAGDLNIGGLVGRSIGDTISNSNSVVTIDAIYRWYNYGKVGGLAGISDHSVISSSSSTATIGGRGISAGGLVGEISGCTITESDAVVTWAEDSDYTNMNKLVGIDNATSIARDRIADNINNRLAPMVTVRGKTLNVKISSTAKMQIRLIDIRGKTLTRFNTTGNGSFSLNKISAGRYFVDMRDMKSGNRFTSAIILR